VDSIANRSLQGCYILTDSWADVSKDCGDFETSVTITQSNRRHIAEDSSLQQHRCENPRSLTDSAGSW